MTKETELNAEQAKKRVLAVYPKAFAMQCWIGCWHIKADTLDANGISKKENACTITTEDAAWISAASSLPEEKEDGKPEIATPEPMVGAWHLVDAIAEGVDERTRFIAAELMQWRKFGSAWNAAKEAKR